MDSKKRIDAVMLDQNKVKTPIVDSTDDFQRFIYELFDKNGILNDLRAYLRGHIVDVLKKSEIGNSTKCEQKFTQRLDLKFQAINILIAEYLLQQEFNFTSSVFVSEIPLSNMVFNYCKTLSKADFQNEQVPRFDEGDIWTIFNYLGIKCDSVNACEIISTYKTIQKPSLLQCILKGVKLYVQNSMQNSEDNELSTTSEASLTTNESDIGSSTCHHYACCKTCQKYVRRIKLKYKKKIKEIRENEYFKNILDVNCFIQSGNEMERTDFNKMFDHVTSIYESEIDRVREKERGKLKQTIELHAFELQTKKDKLEEHFKDREKELEVRIQEKKKFLWTLAKSLRDQHEHLARAIAVVKQEGLRLNNKKESLKKQLIEAEELLTKRGNEMREEITKEILILETYLLDMKTERDDIVKEKEKLDLIHLKSKRDSDIAEKDEDNKIKNDKIDLKDYVPKIKDNAIEIQDGNIEMKDYDKISELIDFDNKRFLSIEQELDNMRNFLKAKFDNTLVENETNTDLNNVPSSKISRVNNDDLSEVVDGAKTMLNNYEEKRQQTRQVVNCLKKQNNVNINGNVCANLVSPRNDMDYVTNLMETLREENMRLKNLSTQQSIHIDQLNAAQERLESELNTTRCTLHAIKSPSCVQPEISRDVIKNKKSIETKYETKGKQCNTNETPTAQPETIVAEKSSSLAKKSSSVGKKSSSVAKKSSSDAKKSSKQYLPQSESEQDAIALREAKLKLKKLEIEAEAVEKSYLEFRKKQTEKILEYSMKGYSKENESLIPKDLYTSTGIQYSSSRNIDDKYENIIKSDFNNTLEQDFEKYLKDYITTYDINKIVLNNRILELKDNKPKTETYLERDKSNTNKIQDFITTPLSEFRKYYSLTPKSVQCSKERFSKLTRDEALSPIEVKCVQKDDSEILSELISINSIKENITLKLSNENSVTKEKLSIASNNNHTENDAKLNIENETMRIIDLATKNIYECAKLTMDNFNNKEQKNIEEEKNNIVSEINKVTDIKNINATPKISISGESLQIIDFDAKDLVINNENITPTQSGTIDEQQITDIDTKNEVINKENVIPMKSIENPQNTISVLVENTVDKIYSDSKYEIEVTIDVNPDKVMNREIIENNENIIKLNPQSDVEENPISDSLEPNHKNEKVDSIINSNKEVNITDNIFKEIPLNIKNIETDDKPNEENSEKPVLNSEISNSPSEENLSFDIDNYNSIGSDGSAISHAASSGDDEFWKV